MYRRAVQKTTLTTKSCIPTRHVPSVCVQPMTQRGVTTTTPNQQNRVQSITRTEPRTTSLNLRFNVMNYGNQVGSASGGSIREQILPYSQNEELIKWLEDVAQLTRPNNVVVCDGSQQEYDRLCADLEKGGVLTKLNPEKRPNSYAAFSTPDDVARLENRTFICTQTKEEAGPTNNWRDPKEMRETMKKVFSGSMEGRTMYVIVYSMGPIGSPLSQIGVEISDSAYVVLNMRIMTRMGKEVLKQLGPNDHFVKCLHSVGSPLKPGQKDVPWPSNKEKYIVHFPETREIMSFGSGYGGNALLGKKCFALRIASHMAKEEGWLAEHMLILGITNPEGKKKYIAAAFPSACGKTNLAMLDPSLPGWKVECVGDDICWMKIGKDGKLYAINPESGFFGVAPGTNFKSNKNAMASISKNTLFTNCALTKDGDVWWEGLTKETPEGLTSWLKKPYDPNSGEKAAHPNARFTAPAEQCPIIDPKWQDPSGVPISAILFGGRRSSTIPLVYESFGWDHGTYLGAAMSSETTSAALDVTQSIRHDPFAMLPFVGYNYSDYFNHWLSFSKRMDPNKLPRIFYVNWFRKDPASGKFIWPGFSENSRVLKWIFERTEESKESDRLARKSLIGYIPQEGSLDISGLDVNQETLKSLFTINPQDWVKEAHDVKEYFTQTFNHRMPQKLIHIAEELENSAKRMQNISK